MDLVTDVFCELFIKNVLIYLEMMEDVIPLKICTDE